MLNPESRVNLHRWRQELLTRAHAGEASLDAARLLALMSVEEAAIFEAGRASSAACERWRLHSQAPPRARAKRRLNGEMAHAI